MTQAESVELNQLLELYDRSVIRRARALALLSFRGFALPNRADLPEPLTDDDAEDTQIAARAIWVSINRHPHGD
ncbi:MAG: hypothetical protein HY327_00095 [Chloroflexi bacterium]|nr:hypothetical protein [Chloroflexota bacterium]